MPLPRQGALLRLAPTAPQVPCLLFPYMRLEPCLLGAWTQQVLPPCLQDKGAKQAVGCGQQLAWGLGGRRAESTGFRLKHLQAPGEGPARWQARGSPPEPGGP